MKVYFALVILLFSFAITKAQQPILKIPTAHTAEIIGFDVSHNGKYIATCATDNSIKLWDYLTKKEINVLKGHRGSVNAVCFSPDDSLLLSGSNDTELRLWDVKTGKCIAIYDTLFNKLVSDVCFSPNGKLMAACSFGGEICVMDIAAKKVIGRFWLEGRAMKIKFFPDGTRLACAGSDSLLSVWSLVDTAAYIKKESFRYLHGEINDFFISRDGKQIFTAVDTKIKNIRIHTVGSVDTFRFNGHSNPALAICAGETDDMFYSMSNFNNGQKFNPDIEIKKWNVPLQKCIDSFYIDINSNSLLNNSIKLSAKKDLVVSNFHTVFTVNTKPFADAGKIKSRTTRTEGILSGDTAFVFTSNDGIIRVLNKANNSLKTKNTNSEILWANFSGDNNKVAIIHRNIIGNNYNSYIVNHDLKSGKTDTIVREKGYISASPGIIQSDDKSRVAYKVIPARGNKLAYDSAVYKIIDTRSGKLIKKTGALYIADVKYLPDNESFILSTAKSNMLFLYKDSTKIVYQDTVIGKNELYNELEVIDSIHVICSETNGISIWNLKTNKIEHKLTVFPPEGAYVNWIHIKLSKDKNNLLLAQKDTVRLLDMKTLKIRQTFTGEMDGVNQIEFGNDGKTILTASTDNSIRVWDIESGKEKYKIIFIDTADWIIVSPQGYYQCTRAAAKLLHYVTKGYKIITFEQLDIKYNRPDKVLEAMDNKDSILIKSYKKAYEKRIKKMGIDTMAFRTGYNVPQADFANRDNIQYEQKDGKLKLDIKSADSTYKLDRFNVWVNETPLYGQRGISLRSKSRNSFDSTITIELSQGENKIEASITNINGTESYRMPLQVNYTPADSQKVKTYFIGIGIDQFKDNKYNLKYSTKDIHDLANNLKEKFSDLIIDTLFNDEVTISNVKELKQKLLQTSVNDKVIISYSGHGILSKDFDYFLSTYDVNFENPAPDGLPYDELENLLDSIPARKKLLLIDACHSGEVDKEELETINANATAMKLKKGNVLLSYKKDENHLGLKNSFELMQGLFVNVAKSTGAIIISAAGGTQFALESNNLKNGVFTYSILEAMNKYPTLKISELKKIVGLRVEELTKGLQKPTSRNETIAVDWEVW